MFSGHPILAEIRQGARLRPTKTNDKSGPTIVAEGETLNKILDESKIPNKPPNCENSITTNISGPPPPPPPIPAAPPAPPAPSGIPLPPKVPKGPVNQKFQSLGGKVTVNQDEFIKSIQGGFKLKPTVTKDKSGLIYDEEQLEIIEAAKHGDSDGKRKVLIEFKKPEECASSSVPPPPPPPPSMNNNVPIPPPPPISTNSNNNTTTVKKPAKPITNPKLLALGGGNVAAVNKDEFLNSIKEGLKLKKVETVVKDKGLHMDNDELQHLSKIKDETKISNSNLSCYTTSSENLLNSSYATSTSSLHNGDNYSSSSSLQMDGGYEPVKKKEFKWKVRNVKEETPPAQIDAGWNEEEKKWNPEKMTDEIPKGSAKARIAMLAKLTSSNESLASNGSSSVAKFKPSPIKKDIFEKKDDDDTKKVEKKEFIKPVKKIDNKMFENNFNNNKSDEQKFSKKIDIKRTRLEDSFDFDGITLNEEEANEIMKEAIMLEERPIPKPLDKSLYEAKFGGSSNSLADTTNFDRKDRDITPKPLSQTLLASPFGQNTETELPSSAQPSPRASPGRFDRETLEAKFGGGNPVVLVTNKDSDKKKEEPKKNKKSVTKKEVTSSKLDILPSTNKITTKPQVAVNGKIKSSEELNTPLSIETKNSPLRTGTVSAMRNQFQKSITPSPQINNNTLSSPANIKSRSLSPLAVDTAPSSPSLSQYKTAPTSANTFKTVESTSESSTPVSLSPVSSSSSIGGRRLSDDGSKGISPKEPSTFGRYNPKNINNSNASRFEQLRKSFNVKNDDSPILPKGRVGSNSPMSGEHIWKQAIKDKDNNINNNNNNNSGVKSGLNKNRAVPIKVTNEYKRFR
uniref:WH2 domain-containing protein n=1 Tax=Parastrongyloides trichosuri TaxID=131310 RepID=A0A0N4ZHQ3_PARTI